MTEEVVISGIIESVIFRNDDNGYAVLKLRTEDGGETIAVGCVPFAGMGEYIEASGVWTTHSSYGEQFKISAFTRALPNTADLILEYLSSGIIKGIGRKTAEKIVDVFGDESLYIIERYPKRLCEVAGITAKKAEQIGRQFDLQNAMMLLMEFAYENKLEPETAVALLHTYGKKAVDIIHHNPYVLSSAEIGVPFFKADELAINMGFEGDARERLEAAVIYELRYNSESGHSFVPKDKLREITARLLNIDIVAIDETIEELIRNGEITEDNICGISACYLSSLYDAETYVAKKLSLMQLKNNASDFNCDEIVLKAEKQSGVVFEPLQRKAIEMAINNSMLLLTGGPGTGKTTVIKGILSACEMMNMKVMLAAPTGRAAKRMTEFCGLEAKTIHRLLEISYNEAGREPFFAKDEDDPLDTDVLIIDEMSMVDVVLFSATLKALPKKCKLILVGDADQLPSVGPGNVFRDMLNSEKFPSVCLNKIFRQAAESDIVVGAHAVNNGEIPDFKKKDNDLFFMSRTSENDLINTVLELCKTRLPDNMDIPSSQIQVLSVSRKNKTGTVELNRLLQNTLNPPEEGKDEKRIGDRVFRVGDRVMQIKNNYTLNWYGMYGGEVGTGVFNGDIGEVISVDETDETLSVSFDSRLVHYSFSMLNELELAYAMTVHKSQGSEFRAVILVAGESSPTLLHRNILYTAMTRARELLIIVGDFGVVRYMVNNNKQRKRYSALKARIIELLS
ncbi:MAG: ATP-dependent RecD-like DNA helicase [Oscillospiraceae bacterium]|nr:ATP-dependent RecD-like DNA helicase [Oscillospiraceae bacterium]